MSLSAFKIERKVDSCGHRRMTFAERGHDWTYGKSTRVPFDHYFSRISEAFESVLCAIEANRKTMEIRSKNYPEFLIEYIFLGIFTDGEQAPFDHIRQIKINADLFGMIAAE